MVLNSYICSEKFTFLISIEANTLFIYAIMTNMTRLGNKALVSYWKYESILKSIEFNDETGIEVFISDGESAFKSKEADTF